MLPTATATLQGADPAECRAVEAVPARARRAAERRAEHPPDHDRRRGFAAPSTFGGVIPTPALDRIANAGLRYTNFHSTALCSPTRAALITGRNHHSVGFGVISERRPASPAITASSQRIALPYGRILQENGYRTSWFGKDHNTPTYQASQAGPFQTSGRPAWALDYF